MHAADLGNAAPAPLPLPEGYRFIAWIQMKDFIKSSGDWAFYGLLAQSSGDADRFVLAIRGTSNPVGLWDDLTSVVPVPWGGTGMVGLGFNRIYKTLRVVDVDPSPAVEAMAAQASAGAGSFAEQVAAALHRHAAASRPAPNATAERVPSPRAISVTGHCLGGALATLYVAEHALKAVAGTALDGVKVSTLCRFASPRTGDPVFAQAFDALPIASWRIVNELDIVPKLPAIGFEHVDRLQRYNSGSLVRWSPTCWHALQTYLHLLDPRQPLDAGCSPAAALEAAPAAMAAMALPEAKPQGSVSKDLSVAVPPGAGTTINITIKVG